MLPIIRNVAGGILGFGIRAAGTEVAKSLFRRVFSKEAASLIKERVFPILRKWVLWLVMKVSNYLPVEYHPKLKDWSIRVVQEVEADWTDEAKIRFVLRCLENQNGRENLLRLIQDKSWDFIKANLPPDVLNLLDSIRKSEAIDRLKDLFKKENGREVKAREISAKIQEAHDHVSGKDFAARARETFERIREGKNDSNGESPKSEN